MVDDIVPEDTFTSRFNLVVLPDQIRTPPNGMVYRLQHSLVPAYRELDNFPRVTEEWIRHCGLQGQLHPWPSPFPETVTSRPTSAKEVFQVPQNDGDRERIIPLLAAMDKFFSHRADGSREGFSKSQSTRNGAKRVLRDYNRVFERACPAYALPPKMPTEAKDRATARREAAKASSTRLTPTPSSQPIGRKTPLSPSSVARSFQSTPPHLNERDFRSSGGKLLLLAGHGSGSQ